MEANCQFKIIYSLKIHIGLQKMGFKAITEMKNPKNDQYNCWVYEASQELLDAFDSLVREGQYGRK